jgi:hypothetical protein
LSTYVDAGYPDDADLVIDNDGRAVLKARRGKEWRASALALEAAIKEPLSERSVGALCARHPGPRDQGGGLAAPLRPLSDRTRSWSIRSSGTSWPRSGCNLGPAHAARHPRGLVTAHELGSTARRHVTPEKVGLADADVVNWYAAPDLALLGDGSSVVADETKHEV